MKGRDQKLKLQLPNARQKLRTLFPQDSRGDIRIKSGPLSFKLQKAFLRLESGFFKKSFLANKDVIQIPQKINSNNFSNVLSCFYGHTVQIPKSQILQYYQVIRYLQVESLLKVLRADMLGNIRSYNIFVVIQLAQLYQQQQLFEICVSQLQGQKFQQLRQCKYQLLRCPLDLFKMIIKMHNRAHSTSGKGVAAIEIDKLIKDYCEEKKLGEDQYQQLKFQLIDKKSLSSQEYKQVFAQEHKPPKKTSIQYRSMIKGNIGSTIGSSVSSKLLSTGKLTESVLNQPIQRKVFNTNTTESHTIIDKRKSDDSKLESSVAGLKNEVVQLRQMTQSNKKEILQLKQKISKKDKELEEKASHDKDQSAVIKRLQKMVMELKRQFVQRGDKIKQLQDKLNKFQRQRQRGAPPVAAAPAKFGVGPSSKYLDIDEDQDQSKTIQSHIVPSFVLKQIAKPAADALAPTSGFKKNKNAAPKLIVTPPAVKQQVQQQMDEEDLQQMYNSRLDFNQQPKGCPKKLLPILANFMTGQGFDKKKLNLLFRRLNNDSDSYGQQKNIYNKSSLLVIIHTRMNEVIGGYTSVELDRGSMDYMSDQNAFIFTLTKNQKFPIKKKSVFEAVFLTTDYLLCFSNDLMIASDCLKKSSQSEWPQAYETGQEKRNSKWLTGQQGAFMIKSIQIYEVLSQAMTMDL